MATRSSKRLKKNDSLFSEVQVGCLDNAIESALETKEETKSVMSPDYNVNYDSIRLGNIKRNDEFLATLGLHENQPSVKYVPSKRGLSSKLQNFSHRPPRRSDRVTIEKIKSEIIELKRSNGDLDIIAKKEGEIFEMLTKKDENDNWKEEGGASNEETAHFRLPPDPISLHTIVNFKELEEDTGVKNLLSVLQHFSPSEDAPRSLGREEKSIDSRDSLRSYGKILDGLRVSADDVAKVTESRITSIVTFSSEDKLLVAAGDKAGYLGLWDVNDVEGVTGGVYRYRPHTLTIINLNHQKHSSLLRSVSYDGTIRSLDIQAEAFTSIFHSSESMNDMIFTDGCFATNGSEKCLISRSDGYLALVDFRQSNDSYSWMGSIADKKINSVEFIPNEEYYVLSAVSGIDGWMCVHDLRMVSSRWKSVMDFNEHSKSINAAYCFPDGSGVVSVSQDNTIRTWLDPWEQLATSSKGKGRAIGKGEYASVESVVTKHCNITGRWLSTFRPAFDRKRSDVFVIGSLDQPRGIQIYGLERSRDEGTRARVSLVSTLRGDYLGSVCSRCCFHDTLDIVVGGNSSGRVHVFR